MEVSICDATTGKTSKVDAKPSDTPTDDVLPSDVPPGDGATDDTRTDDARSACSTTSDVPISGEKEVPDENQKFERTTNVPSKTSKQEARSKANPQSSTKDKIQSAVNMFNLLDSVEKACFFHCSIPSMSPNDLENLKFSISLNRNIKENKSFKKQQRKKSKNVCKDNQKLGNTKDRKTSCDDQHETTTLRMSPRIKKKEVQYIVEQNISCSEDEPNTELSENNAYDMCDSEGAEAPVKTGPKSRKQSKLTLSEQEMSDDEDDNYEPPKLKHIESKATAANSKSRKRSNLRFSEAEASDDSHNDYILPLEKTNTTKPKSRKLQKLSAKKDGAHINPLQANQPKPKRKQRKQARGSISHLICKKCGQVERTEAQLSIHIAMNHLPKNFKCKTCSKRFLNEDTLALHVLMHSDNNKTLHCADCQKQFSTAYELNLHRKSTHQVDQRFDCPVCSRSFVHYRNLQRHVTIHGQSVDENVRVLIGSKNRNYEGVDGNGGEYDERTFVAAVCNDDGTTTGKDQFNGASPRIISLSEYRCDLCGSCFKSRQVLWRHQKTHTGERPHQCSLCGKAFLDKTMLVAHERTHTGEKPFVCELCGLRFTQRSNLTSHNRRVHLHIPADKMLMCDRCPYSFRDKTSLQRHYLVHTGEKAYVCRYCQRRFARSKDVKLHERTHTGERPYRCKVCGKTFADGSNYKVHEKTHTEGDKCPTCLLLFRNLREFRKHVKLCRPTDAILFQGQEGHEGQEVEQQQRQQLLPPPLTAITMSAPVAPTFVQDLEQASFLRGNDNFVGSGGGDGAVDLSVHGTSSGFHVITGAIHGHSHGQAHTQSQAHSHGHGNTMGVIDYCTGGPVSNTTGGIDYSTSSRDGDEHASTLSPRAVTTILQHSAAAAQSYYYPM